METVAASLELRVTFTIPYLCYMLPVLMASWEFDSGAAWGDTLSARIKTRRMK